MQLAISHVHAVVDRITYAVSKAWPAGMHHPSVEDDSVPLDHTAVQRQKRADLLGADERMQRTHAGNKQAWQPYG